MSSLSHLRSHRDRRGSYIPLPQPASPFLAPTKPSLAAILAILRSVDAAATLVCNEINKALKSEHEVQALNDLRKGVENLKSDIIVYEVLMKDPHFGCKKGYVIGLRSTEPIINNITARKECMEWKTLRERSRLRD
jgi:hypothetical protein